MSKVIEIIDIIQNCIFSYKLEDISTNLSLLVEELFNKLEVFSKDESRLNQILNNINISISNKDYLLLADVLEYELKAFVKFNGEG